MGYDPSAPVQLDSLPACHRCFYTRGVGSPEGLGGSVGCSSASGCWADAGGIALIVGLAIIAALAIGMTFLMIRVNRRAPASQPAASGSFALSRGGLLLSVVIPIGAFALQAIF